MMSLFISYLLLSLGVHSIDGSLAFVSLPAFQSLPPTTSSIRSLTTDCDCIAPRRTCLHATSGSGFGNKNPKTNEYAQSFREKASSSSSSPSQELFELQELRAQLQTILKQNILVQNLSKEKREELSKYVKAVVEKTDSPINFAGKGGNTMGIAQFVAGVEGKSWRMVYSTNNSDSQGGGEGGELPFGSTVMLRIGEFMGSEGTLDYVLTFSKQVMGLNELVAKSTCSVDVSVLFTNFIGIRLFQDAHLTSSNTVFTAPFVL